MHADASGREWSKYDGLLYMFLLAEEGLSLNDIVKEMREIGFSFPASSVGFILSNRFYVGELPLNRPNGSTHSDEWVKGVHEPFIDPVLFERVRLSRERNKRGGAKVRKSARIYALRGICTCSTCGGTMHCNSDKGRPRLQCYNRRLKKIPCDQPMVGQEPLLRQLLAHLENLRPPEERISAILASVQGEMRDVAKERQRIHARLRKLKITFLEMEEMEREEYEARKAEYERQLALLEPMEQTAGEAEELARYLRDFSAWFTDANDRERNQMLHHLMTKIVVQGKEIKAVAFAPQVHWVIDAYRSYATSTGSPACDPTNEPHCTTSCPKITLAFSSVAIRRSRSRLARAVVTSLTGPTLPSRQCSSV